ncbi:MAG: dephospho-CoA kinase [candidate division Zixibacteria bacterium]|nr:dephospho-CoA kinase [candidate division Zixibacteria bacterium]
MLIGVTGQIGSGKSTAAEILQSLGAVVIDADLIGHQVVDESKSLRNKLVSEFGQDIIDSSGRVNRKKLAARAFRDEQSKKKLDTLVHPYLLNKLYQQIRSLQKSHDVIVLDAALLLNWDINNEMDYILMIHSSLKDRLRRLQVRGISRQDALARQKTQLPFRIYQQHADRVILNNDSIASLRDKLYHLWKRLILKPVDKKQNRR